MSQTWSWSFSVGDAEDGDLWALEPCDVFPIASAQSLLSSRRKKAMVVVANDLVQPLLLCQQFRTLDGHIEAMVGAFPPLARHRGRLRQVLEQLRQQGLLLNASSLLKGLGQRGGDALPPIERVAVITCDRPDLLRRLLKSFIDNERRHGNRYRYVIFDDSRQEASRRENRALVQALRDEGLRAAYQGPEEQAAR
ncbi:MAG: hypothetical protein D6819_10115, partial [Gammaproteobacteria bacterium]